MPNNGRDISYEAYLATAQTNEKLYEQRMAACQMFVNRHRQVLLASNKEPKLQQYWARKGVKIDKLSNSCAFAEFGEASFYGIGDGFLHKRSSGGVKLTNRDPTVAHRTLPFGTILLIMRTDNPKVWALAVVTDHGPFAIKGHGTHRSFTRIVDVSPMVARELNLIKIGHAKVAIQAVLSVFVPTASPPTSCGPDATDLSKRV